MPAKKIQVKCFINSILVITWFASSLVPRYLQKRFATSFLHNFLFVSDVSKAVAAYMNIIITQQSHSALYLKHIYIFFIICYVYVYTYVSSIAPLPVVARYVLTFLEYNNKIMTLCLFVRRTLPLVWNLIWKQYIYSQSHQQWS